MLYTGRLTFLLRNASAAKLTGMSVGSAEEENFVFFREDYFCGGEGQAYLKTLDVCLLVRFLNVLALWSANETQILILTKSVYDRHNGLNTMGLGAKDVIQWS